MLVCASDVGVVRVDRDSVGPSAYWCGTESCEAPHKLHPYSGPMLYQWLPGQMTCLHACTRPMTAHCLLCHVVQGVSTHFRRMTDRMTFKGNK